MPSVCVTDCGLVVDGGSIGLEWTAVGAKWNSATAQGWSTTSIPNTLGDWESQRVASTSFSNTTCREHVVFPQARIPNVRFAMGEGNRWRVGVNLVTEVNALPPVQEPGEDAGIVALGHPATAVGIQRLEVGVVTWPRLYGISVAPGDTLNMTATVWFQTLGLTSNESNFIEARPMTVAYQAFPVA